MLKIKSPLPVVLHNFLLNNLYISISPIRLIFLPLLKRVKTNLRSTTGEVRLNHLMPLHVHKELADGIDMVEVTKNLFVGHKQRRKHLFGKFS